MTRLTRLFIVLAVVAAIGGSSLAGIAVGQRNGRNAARETLETRIAALEAASKARLEGIGNEISGLRQAVSSDGNSVTVEGEAYLPSSLKAVVIAFQIRPTRSTVGAAVTTAQNISKSVTRAVEAAGVSDGDVRTVWDTTFPSYERPGAYTAQARVLTTVRNVPRIDAITKVALKVHKDVSVGYLNVSDESATEELAEARAEALAEARSKALRYAQAAGRKLGKLISVSEQVAPESSPATPGGDESGYSYRPAFIVVVDAVYELA